MMAVAFAVGGAIGVFIMAIVARAWISQLEDERDQLIEEVDLLHATLGKGLPPPGWWEK